MDVMNKDPNTVQVLPMTNDNEVVFMHSQDHPNPFVPSPTIPGWWHSKEGPHHVPSLLWHILQEMCTFHETANAVHLQFPPGSRCGTEEAPKDTDFPTSQLAVLMEELELDTILMQWAIYQFGGTMHIANLHDISKGYNKKKTITKNHEGIDADEGIHGKFFEGAIILHKGDQVPGPNFEAQDSSYMPYHRGLDAKVGMHGNQADEAISPCEGNVMHATLLGSRTPAWLQKNCRVSGAIPGICSNHQMSVTFSHEWNTTSQPKKQCKSPTNQPQIMVKSLPDKADVEIPLWHQLIHVKAQHTGAHKEELPKMHAYCSSTKTTHLQAHTEGNHST